MQRRSQFVDVKCDAMGLVRRGSGLHLARILGDELDQLRLAGISQQFQLRVFQ